MITAWIATATEQQAYAETYKGTLSADEIADREDVSAHFTNKFTVVRPVQRVTVQLTAGMMRELDARAARLDVSRQTIIKTLLQQVLDKGQSRPGPRRKDR